MTRHQVTSPALDEAERAWWGLYADLEEHFCWVQTPRVQRFLRSQYLRRALTQLNAGDTVLEVGCGTGWLSLLLARMGAGEVVGLDFSGPQIVRARAAAAHSPSGHRMRFVQGGLSDLAAEMDRPFDMVVLHAFLHHLSTQEIDDVLDGAVALLKPGGRIVVVEPVVNADAAPWPSGPMRRLLWLERAPMALHRRRLRRLRDPEANARRRLAGRCHADTRGGPSPKEHPFAPGELEAFLGARVRLDAGEPCLGRAHLVAQEMLLVRLSQPRAWGAALLPVLWVARALDRRLLATDPKPPNTWVFYLYIGTKDGRPDRQC